MPFLSIKGYPLNVKSFIQIFSAIFVSYNLLKPDEAKLKFPEWVVPIVEYSPLTQIIEGFRFMLLNSGIFDWMSFGYTTLISIVIFLLGLIIFNRTEKSFIDTV